MKKIFMLVLLLLFLISYTAFAADSWTLVGSNDKGTVSFSPDSIKYDLDSKRNIDKNIIDVKLKTQFNADGLNWFISDRKDNDDTTNWENLSYMLIDAKINRTYRLLSTYTATAYDASGHIIKSTAETIQKDLKQDGIDADLYDAIVTYANQHDQDLEGHPSISLKY